MEVFRNIEVEIRIEESLTCKFAFAILIIYPLVPLRVRTISIFTYVVWNICNY